MLLKFIRIVIVVLTAAIGIWALIKPTGIEGFTGLTVTGPRGVTEIRAIMGGVFIALALAPYILGIPSLVRVLGFTYLVIAAVRVVAIFIDGSGESSNWISFGSEVVMGILLLIGW